MWLTATVGVGYWYKGNGCVAAVCAIAAGGAFAVAAPVAVVAVVAVEGGAPGVVGSAAVADRSTNDTKTVIGSTAGDIPGSGIAVVPGWAFFSLWVGVTAFSPDTFL